MHYSLLKFTVALHSALLFWIPLDFELVLGVSVSSSENCPSTRCASAANVLCRDIDLFGTKTLFLKHIL
jgi:hypothetical protein